MVKKLNRDAFLIKLLLEKGIKQCDIVKLLHLKKQKVSYWANTELKNTQKRRKKLNEIFVTKIRELARNKTTSAMSSRKIAAIINQELEKENVLDKNNKPLTIHHGTVCAYLREYYGKPKKIRKTFFLNPEQMQRRVEYCNMIIDRKINFDQIMFTDECIIDLSSYTNDSIRLDPMTKEQLKVGDRKVYDLVNRPKRKYEKYLMIAGGICYYGVSHLMFLEGTMNDFAYGQALLFYKEDIEAMKDKFGIKLIFEQDGAATHRTKANITLLNRLFTKSGWIQNSPNSPDLAYPIEDLWSIIKPRVRRRNPNTIIELKQYLLEEWNSIPIELIQNLCKGFLSRVEKVIELKGARLEPEHFKKTTVTHGTYVWEKPKFLPNMRVVYNNKKIYKFKKREIKIMKSELKKVVTINVERMKTKVPETKKKEVEYANIIRSTLIKDGLEKACEVKRKYVRQIRDMIETVEEMNLVEYIEHLKEIAKEKKELERDKKKNRRGDEERRYEHPLDEPKMEEIDYDEKASAMYDEEEGLVIFDDENTINTIGTFNTVQTENTLNSISTSVDEILIEQKITELLDLKTKDRKIRYHVRF